MSIDIPTLVSELRVNLGGLDTTDLGDTDALLLLNRAYWELIDRYKFREKEVTAKFQTVAGVSFYTTPQPFEAIFLVSIEDIYTYQHITLDRMTQFEYENLYVNDPTGQDQKKPTKYLREANGFRLWRTPDQAYTITIKYWTVLADLANVANTFPGPPQVWHEVILQGATSRGFRRLGDYQRAQAAQAEFERLNSVYQLVPAKEEADTHRGGLDVIGYDDVYYEPVQARDVSRQQAWPWNNA